MDNAADEPNRMDHHVWSVVRQQFRRQFAHVVAADFVLQRHRSVESGGAKHQWIYHYGIRGDVGLCSIWVFRRFFTCGCDRQFIGKLLADRQL